MIIIIASAESRPLVVIGLPQVSPNRPVLRNPDPSRPRDLSQNEANKIDWNPIFLTFSRSLIICRLFFTQSPHARVQLAGCCFFIKRVVCLTAIYCKLFFRRVTRLETSISASKKVMGRQLLALKLIWPPRSFRFVWESRSVRSGNSIWGKTLPLSVIWLIW